MTRHALLLGGLRQAVKRKLGLEMDATITRQVLAELEASRKLYEVARDADEHNDPQGDAALATELGNYEAAVLMARTGTGVL